jgi:biotin synthase-related radical SAM superfamily protein
MAMTVNTGKDTQVLQKEKGAALMSLGKLMHKLIRDGKIEDANCARLSERIAQIDTDICNAGGGRVPGQGEGICPICNKPLSSLMAQFCGGCGTNIADYYSQSMAKCDVCKQLIMSGSKYCTVCGVLRATQGDGA